MSQTVNTADLDRLVERWDRLVREFPQQKRALMERMAPKMLELVQQEIGGSGTVQGWQGPHIGSGGGYAAVRPEADTYKTTPGGKRYAVGYVTNAIEGGHKHGGQRGSERLGYRYRPRIKTAAVPGKHFYQKVRQILPNLAESEIRSLLQTIKEGLEGDA